MHRRRKKKPKKPAGPKIDGRRSTVTDAEIVAELSRNGGRINDAAATLHVRDKRVAAVSKKHGGLAEVKKRESAFAAVEGAVINLGGVLETVRLSHDPDVIRAVAMAMGVSVEKMLLMAGKSTFNAHVHNTGNAPPAPSEAPAPPRGIDLGDIIGVLDRETVERLLDAKDRLNGVERPEELSDLDNPEVYDDQTYQPPAQPGRSP